jgi:hypothetical protein
MTSILLLVPCVTYLYMFNIEYVMPMGIFIAATKVLPTLRILREDLIQDNRRWGNVQLHN